MIYNFDEIIERRGTHALNTDGFRGYIFHAGPEATFAFKDEEFVRMWVADMEFAVAEPVREAMKRCIDNRIFGYTGMYDSEYFDAFSSWCRRRYDLEIKREELCFSTGVIPAFIRLMNILVKPGEKVSTFTPGYSQFLNGANFNKVELVPCALKNGDKGFEIDFELFEKHAADPMMKLVILCNPHNPTGRIWTEEELKRVAEICERYNLWLLSDEIHCDLVRCGRRYTPMAKVMPDYKKLISCMAPSKSFNMAGLMMSDVIIRSEELRETFNATDINIGFVNPVSMAAHIAAFTEGDEWLDQMRAYLDENFRFTKDYLGEHLPAAVCYVPEATYLAWVDMNRCLPEGTDLPMFFANEAGVLLEGGDSLFISDARGFIRLNLAMPRSIIAEGLRRICQAVNRKA